MLLTISRINPNGVITIGGAVGILRPRVPFRVIELTVEELEEVRARLLDLQASNLISFSTEASSGTTDDAAEGATVGYVQEAVSSAVGTGVAVLHITTSTSLPNQDACCFVATTAANVNLTAPDPTGTNTGRQFPITKTTTDTHKITWVRHGGEKVNGVAADLDLPGSSLGEVGRWHAISDGTDWWVF